MTNEENKKTLEVTQEEIKIDRSNFSMGSLQPEAEGSTAPDSQKESFEQTVTSHPTFSYPLLQFSTENKEIQRRFPRNYHEITSSEMRRLNQYAPFIQRTAQWYLENIADSKIYFVYQNQQQEKNVLEVSFKKENFVHLTGIRPFAGEKNAEDFLQDFAEGKGHYENIAVSQALQEKLQVLPMLEDITDSHSFVLNDLSSVEKLHRLNFSEAIKAKDEEFLLLFKDIGEETVPASLMKLKGNLRFNILREVTEQVILGVYRERDNELTQLSINEDYIYDNGENLTEVMKKHVQFSRITPEQFTQVLEIAFRIEYVKSEEVAPLLKPAVSYYYQLLANALGDKDKVVAVALEENLIDTKSVFYEQWLETQSTTRQAIEEVIDSMDLSEYKYFVEDEELWNQVVDQLPYDMPTEDSPIFFTQSSQPDVIGYVSFNGTDEVMLEEVMEYFQEHGIHQLEDQQATLQKWKEEIESLGETVSEIIQQASQSLNAPQLNLQNHWKIEYTSLDNHALIQSNHIVTRDVLHALQEQDELLHQEQTSHFIYLEHYFNGVRIASLPLDLGNGIEANEEVYQTLRRTFENQTDVQETLQKLKQQTQELTTLYSYEKEEIEKLVVRSHFDPTYALRTLSDRMSSLEDYIIRPLDLSKDRLSTETIEKHTKEMRVLEHLANNSEVKNRYGHSVEELIQWMNHPTQWLLEKATSLSQTDYWQIGFIDRPEMNPGVQEGEVVTEETLEAIQRLQQNNVHGSYYETTLYHFVDGEVVEQHPFRLGIMEEKEKGMIDLMKESFIQKTPQSISEIIANKDYKGLKRHIEEGIHDYLKGDTFKAYLDFVSKLPTFSFRNVQLLYRQKQDATIVMNSPKWKALGRYVNKGEKALYIYRPYHVPMKDENGEPLLDENGKEIQKTYFKLTPVFDISQTNGKEIPRMTYDLEEDFKDPKVFIAMYKAIVGCTTATVRGEEFPPEERMRGYFRPSTNEIVIRKGLGQVMAIKTLIHEVVHSRLHKENDPTGTNRKQEEFEAEATAYIVSNHFGIDTSDYSFGYLANWTSGGKDIAQFADSLERITNEAKVLIDTIEQAMVKIKTVELEKQPANKFEERVQLAQKKQAEVTSKETHSSLGQKVEDVQSSKK